MTIPLNSFALVIIVCLIVVAVSPLILVGLWIADLRNGVLW